jgi:superoxide oxidase
MRNQSEKYSQTARVLHWISAIVILWATVSGFYITTQNVDEATKSHIANFNVSVTLFFIPLFIARVLYRLWHGAAIHSRIISRAEVRAAKILQMLLYATTSVALLSGVLMLKEDVMVFHAFNFHHPSASVAVQQFFKQLHTTSTMLLAALVCLHLLALAKHEVTGKRILYRML